MLEVRNVSVQYGGGESGTVALSWVNLTIEPGEFVVALGASGCGKTTLLSCIAGFLPPTDGDILLDGKPVTGPGADRGVVFQRHALMPWLNVVDNVAFGLKMQGMGKAERTQRARGMLEMVGLAAFADKRIYELSGGMQQRVGIARALAPRPRILLCDEATSALDPETTQEILALVKRLRDQLDLTVLLITHEMAVVKEICDRVAVMERGQVIEEGRVFDVFTRPSHPTTRRFIADTIGHSVPPGTVARLPAPGAGEERRLLQVLFAGPHSTRSVISEASRRFGLDLNIISGRIDEIAGEPFGLMALAAYGAPERIDAALAWFAELGLAITPLTEAEIHHRAEAA